MSKHHVLISLLFILKCFSKSLVILHESFIMFFFSVDEETNEAWDSTCNSFDNYEELKENIYSKELEQLALNSIQVCLFVAITTLFIFIYIFWKFFKAIALSSVNFCYLHYNVIQHVERKFWAILFLPKFAMHLSMLKKCEFQFAIGTISSQILLSSISLLF